MCGQGWPLALSVHDGVGERLEFLPVRPAVQRFPSFSSVVERHLAGVFKRARRCHAHECSLDRPARERRAHRVVVARSEQERQRRSTFAQVRTRNLPRLDRVARAVEDVVRDLEGDAELEALTDAVVDRES